MTCFSLQSVVFAAALFTAAANLIGVAAANEQPLAVGVDADTMIALDTNSTALSVNGGSSGAFGTGLEEANPLGALPMTIRGGNAFDTGSLSTKPLIRFNLGSTANVHIDPTLPYFVELTTQTDANSNDTFRIYSITDPSTRSFNEATLTWDNAPPVATASKQDFEAAGTEDGVFYRPSTIDVAGTSIGHPLMGSQIATFTNGANTYATFGLAGTGTNRWILTDRTSSKPSRLITYDVIESATSGALTTGGTWAGTANQANTLYRVGSGHSVTVNGAAPFAGKAVVVGTHATGAAGDYDGNGSVGPEDFALWRANFGNSASPSGSGADGNGSGSIDAGDYVTWRKSLGGSSTLSTLNFTANNVDLPLIVINADGQFTNGTGASLAIGNPSLTPDQVNAGGASGSTVKGSTGGLIINRDYTYNALAASPDLTINIPLISNHNFTFSGVAGSDLNLRFPAGERGKINFNGAGNEVVVSENQGIGGTLVMNATGTNTLAYTGIDSEQETDKGTVIFNHAGTIDHRSDRDHLQGTSNLVANAPVTIDLSKTYPTGGQTDERAFEITRNLSGSAPITVQGMLVAPTGTGNTDNQFQIGATTAAFTNLLEVDYTGTLTTQGYAEVDARAGMPKAKINVNRNGILATGFEPHVYVPDQAAPTTRFGEINVMPESSAGASDGGKLEVGYLNSTTGNGDHAPQNLRLTKSSGQNGNLTLASGTSLVMQINGPPNYVPPQVGDPGNCSDARQSSCKYDGPAFDTIEVEGLATLAGKLIVHLDADTPFQAEASDTTPPDPDYYPPTVGDTWDIIKGVNGGLITGTFSSVTVVDTLHDLSPTQTFQVIYTSSTLVQLRLVDTAGLGTTASVPEPGSLSLTLLTILAVCAERRRQR